MLYTQYVLTSLSLPLCLSIHFIRCFKIPEIYARDKNRVPYMGGVGLLVY